MVNPTRDTASNASFWTDKTVIVTGGSGFLGTHVVEELRARGCGLDQMLVPRKSEYNLVHSDAVRRLFQDARAMGKGSLVVIHMAATVGGIGANRDNPGLFFYENIMMGVQMIEEARLQSVEKFVQLGTVCAYPKFTPVPFQESELWNGYPEETNAPYGIAKKALLVQLQGYRDQYKFNGIFLLPTNLYGPRDNFDPHSSHVIPALIKKCVDATERGDRYIDVWGTGSASREFLFVEDAAKAIVLATECFNGPEPVNIGASREIAIKDLVPLIAELTGFTGEIRWDSSKPDGQPRRGLDTTRAKELFGFVASTDFRAGLRKTIDWYLESRRKS